MYTQCPECSTAFRVTAEVLKQASGKVRCGGCGRPFNALEYLSEGMPEQLAAKEPEAPLPELTPEPLPTNGGVPRSISAEQSAALLKTLDQLAGSDIRIEDTGVEWRVHDEDEAPDSVVDELLDEDEAPDSIVDELLDEDEAPDSIVDELLDEDEAPDSGVDELLDESPTPVDQFLTKTPTNVEAAEIFEESANALAQTPVDELRFDDNTPLPDDFDLDDESSYLPETGDAGDAVPEARTEPGQEAESRDETEDSRVDVMLGEPDEWADILGEVDEPAEPVAEEVVVAPPDVAPTPLDTAEKILDVDTQFALQAEAMGIDLSGMHPAPEFAAEEAATDVDEESYEEADEAPDEGSDEELEIELVGESEEQPVGGVESEPELELESSAARRYPIDDEEDEEEEQAPLEFGSIDTAMAQLEEQSDVFDKNFFQGAEEVELQDDEALDAEIDDEELDSAESEDSSYVIPPQTEEEQTLNMMIDQDLLSFAVEDEDGFASTIVIPEKDAEDEAVAERLSSFMGADISTGFETIVMEGESIRSAPDAEKREADIAAAAALAKQAKAARDEERTASPGARRRGMTAAIVLLALLLLVQVMHQSREALATIPAFNNVVGIVYRAVGKPLSPAWDVTGWRFEATQEVIDQNDDQLTIYSRIGNTSDSSLPYPLINVALIDRFEETVGNRTLDPAEYLTDDLDPSKPVPPGNTFNAAISIQSPAPDATGYKLKVCYRQSAGQLRCSNPSFK